MQRNLDISLPLSCSSLINSSIPYDLWSFKNTFHLQSTSSSNLQIKKALNLVAFAQLSYFPGIVINDVHVKRHGLNVNILSSHMS